MKTEEVVVVAIDEEGGCGGSCGRQGGWCWRERRQTRTHNREEEERVRGFDKTAPVLSMKCPNYP